MSIADQRTAQSFPYPRSAVFEAFQRAIGLCGYEIQSADEAIGRLTAKAGMSALSFGENLVIRVDGDDARAEVTIESSLRFGANVTAAHRHHKNFDALITKASEILRDPLAVEKQVLEKKEMQKKEESSVLTLAALGVVVLLIVLFLKFGT